MILQTYAFAGEVEALALEFRKHLEELLEEPNQLLGKLVLVLLPNA